MTELLELRHLKIRRRVGHDVQTLVHDVSLSIDAGEAVGLVGESGSGKSLTARAITDVLPPGLEADGDRLFRGRDIGAMSRQELRRYRTRDVAMIFQDPRAHINPVRTIGDFMTEALVSNSHIRKSEAEKVAAGLLEEVGITDASKRLRQYPHELSGGMLQRVMIAAAIAPKPTFIIADEPTTALDVTIQAEVVAILNDLRRERGMGMLFITHDLDLAAAVCDRTAVMYAGSLVEMQASEKLHVRPRHPYAAVLSSSRPEVGMRADRLPVLPGSPISGADVGTGCAFAGRCAYADHLCAVEIPRFRPVDDALVACHHAEKLDLVPDNGGSRV